MGNIRLAEFVCERYQVTRGHDALVELLQIGCEHCLPEFLLADEKYLDERTVVPLQVRKQAQLFQGITGQALGFIDDESRASLVVMQVLQTCFQTMKMLGLAARFTVQLEFQKYQAQQVVCLDLG